MKILILTCNTGEGHNSAAAAIKEVFNDKGYECEITDSLRFLSRHVSKFISSWHSRIYKYAPKAFGKGYSLAENHTSFTSNKSILYHFLTTGIGKLNRFICKGEYDVVLCVHPFSALMLTKLMRKRKLKIITGFIATDYTCSPTVSDSELDVYFIPHEDLKGEFSSCGISIQKLFASGIPVRQKFYSISDKHNAKIELGFPADKRNILLMGGSMGCGPLKKMTSVLSKSLPEDTILTVLCGRNKRLYRKLSKNVKSNVRIMGFTNKMSQLMDSAEIYLTKAGGLSTTEAASKQLPMILINAVSGCETYNKNFFVSRGCALSLNSINEVPAVVNQLLNDKALLNSYSIRLKEEFNKNSAALIADYFIHKINGPSVN